MATKLNSDRVLLTTVLLLTGFGLVMVYSASALLAAERGLSYNPLFVKQCIAAALGLLAMLVLLHVPYTLLRRPVVMYGMLFANLVMLVAVLFSPELNNSRRWLFLGGVSIQPSEFAKLAIVLYLAYQIDRKTEGGKIPAAINSYPFLVPTIFATGLAASLILFGRDLGTTALLCLPPFLMVVLAGLSVRYLALGAAVLFPVGAAAAVLEPYRLKRLVGFLDPEGDPLGSGFQVLQSLIAVGSGGLFGRGLGDSLQKLYFLPSPHADFIFSIVAEELGLLGAFFLLTLFVVLVWRGIAAGQHAPDELGRYLAWGMTALLGVQALLHISVSLGLAPTTGVPLPFISHGGSSLLATLLASAVILNVSQHRVSRPISVGGEPWHS